ncbi:hypothetical protein BC834DRAFT_864874 [Gloeopeniophorella convolvens]|nr:hypothetical protein BC834DRAFT_864874 [Gloeopeniophorella convolvens]
MLQPGSASVLPATWHPMAPCQSRSNLQSSMRGPAPPIDTSVLGSAQAPPYPCSSSRLLHWCWRGSCLRRRPSEETVTALRKNDPRNARFAHSWPASEGPHSLDVCP